MAYTKIRPAISKIWVLEDRDAIRTNTQEVIALTKTLLSSVAPSYRDKLQALSFAANPNELLSENAKFVATLDVRTVSLLFREIQRKSILRFCMMKEPEFPHMKGYHKGDKILFCPRHNQSLSCAKVSNSADSGTTYTPLWSASVHR